MTNDDALKEGEALAGMLTVRDRFAMAALKGLMSSPEYVQKSDMWLAKFSYRQADAMLIERAKERG